MKNGDEDKGRGDHWNTPHLVVDLLAEFWPWGIDLDPCSNLTSIVPARVRAFAPVAQGGPTDDELEAIGLPKVGKGRFRRNGLALDWGRVVDSPPATAYVNPKFSKPADWVERCYQTGVSGLVESILCVPVQTSSMWWRRWVRTAAARCDLDKRLAFLDEDGEPIKGNPRDSSLVYYGPDLWRFREVFRRAGEVRIL